MIFNKQGATIRKFKYYFQGNRNSETRNRNSETVYISRIYIHNIWKKTPRN